ncbi:DUF1294 domain-containing protein [Microbacterium sp. CFBP9034]|uniref:DUF1294 domain-containing protein n=1 Tax=Microbacterium sp. CFBP9034 TaxID=3096540 RepID=UPI002A69B71F|nr:DUF1294 domain-containing protein [Microbacterium sp. CFBP9034]MDY0910051.1 DUF1294 domain-containing protein [Microbacterium sp. CFBP9034]
MPSAPARRPSPPSAERTGSDRDLSRPLPAALSWTVLIAFVAAFALTILILGLPWWMPALYAVLSLIAFAAYGLDKSAARRDAPRTSEQTLLALGLLGGWPGALIAQQVFRHKTRKRSFRRAFWRTVVLNVLLLGTFIALATLRGWDLEPTWLGDLVQLFGL